MSLTTPDTEGGSADDVEGVTVTVHLRSAPSTPAVRRQEVVLDRLRELEEHDVVPDLTIERWSAQVSVPVQAGDSDAGAVELFEEFEAAADEAGLRLEPFFESREAVGGLLSSGPSASRILVFPVICLTIRRDGDLTGLYPCWNDGVHQSIEDVLGALADGDAAENL
jgi:hypothetical protein